MHNLQNLTVTTGRGNPEEVEIPRRRFQPQGGQFERGEEQERDPEEDLRGEQVEERTEVQGTGRRKRENFEDCHDAHESGILFWNFHYLKHDLT